MKRLFFAAYAVFSCFYASAEVEININQQPLHFDSNPRLDEVLKPVAYQQQWYWPASYLYRNTSTTMQKLRIDVIAKLKFIQLSAADEQAALINHLIQQLQSWTLAERIFIKIDYDLAQLLPEYNPRFEDGAYRLDLHTRPQKITIIGMLDSPKSVDLLNNNCADNYIKQYNVRLDNPDYLYVIAPTGIVNKVGIAYWNRQCVDVMPGSQLYLPLEESQFFSQNSELNQQIIELAKNRIF